MKRTFDIFVSALLIVFFVGYVNIHSDIIGLHERPVPGGNEVEEFWEWLAWIVFAALAADIYLKYRQVRDPKEFVKKHWPDIAMLALMPLCRFQHSQDVSQACQGRQDGQIRL